MKAIKWTLTNQPRGDSYRTWGTKRTEVRLDFDDDFISRVKTASKNDYETKEGICRNFGNSVPTQARKVCPVSDLNFQGQHDAPFLLADTAGQVGAKLSSYVDLAIIGDLMNVLRSWRRKTDEEVERLGKEIVDVDCSLGELPDLNAMKRELIKLTKLLTDCALLNNKSDKLDSLVTDLSAVELLLYPLQDAETAVPKIENLISLRGELDEAKNQLVHFDDLFESGKTLNAKIKELDVKKEAKEGVDGLIVLWDSIFAVDERARNLEFTLSKMMETEEELISLEKAIHFQEEILTKELETCPLCGRTN